MSPRSKREETNYLSHSCNETFAEHSLLLKFEEGDNKDLGLWFIVPGSWLKGKNQKQQTRDQIIIVIEQKGVL